MASMTPSVGDLDRSSDSQHLDVGDVEEKMTGSVLPGDFVQCENGEKDKGPHGKETCHEEPMETFAFWEEFVDRHAVTAIKNQIEIDTKYDLTERRLQQIHSKFIVPKNGCEGMCEALRFQGVFLSQVQLAQLLTQLRKGKKKEEAPITYEEFRFVFKRLKMAQVVHLSRQVRQGPGMRVNVIEYPEYPEERLSPQSSAEFRPLESWLFKKRDETEKMRWVHAEGFDLHTLVALAAKYQFHPLAVEDAITMHKQAAKIDRYGEHVFCGVNVLQLFVPGQTPQQIQRDLEQPPAVAKLSRITSLKPSENSSSAKRLIESDSGERFEDSSPLSKEWQVPNFSQHSSSCAREHRSNSLASQDLFGLAQELKRPSSKLMVHKCDFVLYKIIDGAVNELSPIIAAYTYRLKYFQNELQRAKTHFNRQFLEEITSISLELKDMQRTVRPLTGVLKLMFEDQTIGRDFAPYVEDLRDKVAQRIEDFKELMDICKHIADQYRDLSDRKMNDTLYVLTIVTTVFIPAQFVTGMYGMNFVDEEGNPAIPELMWKHGYLYFWVLVLALTCCSGLLFRLGH